MDLRLMEAFRQYLLSQEKRPATREKYLRDVRNYVNFLGDQEVSLSVNLAYKQYLEEQYAPASANSMIAAVNAFLSFLGREDLKLKRLRVQKKAYCPESAELTRGDYEKLVLTARAGGKQRLALVIQTLCARPAPAGGFPRAADDHCRPAGSAAGGGHRAGLRYGSAHQ